MNEMVLSTNTFPEPIIRLMHAEKVLVQKTDAGVQLTPVTDEKKGCPIRGICADGKLSSYTFIERKQAEKELD